MKVVKVEQTSLFDVLPNDGGEGSQQNSPTIEKTKRPKQGSKTSSKYKVNVGGIEVYGIVDYVQPTYNCPFWTFTTYDDKQIVATGNVIIEAK